MFVDARDGHLAFRVADYDGALARLRAHGVPVVEQWENQTPWAQIVTQAAVTEDEEGES